MTAAPPAYAEHRTNLTAGRSRTHARKVTKMSMQLSRTHGVRKTIAVLLSLFVLGSGASLAQDTQDRDEIDAGLPRADLLSELQIDPDGTVVTCRR